MKIWCLLLFIAIVHAKYEEFSGWKSYYIGASTPGHFDTLRTLKEKYQLDILGPPTDNREGVVLVKPDVLNVFLQSLDNEGIPHRVHVEDIKSQLELEDKQLQLHKLYLTEQSHGRSFPYNSYQDINVLENYINYIGETYPKITTVVEAGKSFEGHPIKYLKISTTNFQDPKKPIIFIEAGTHAREWITIPVATWAIHKLVEDITEQDLLDRFDWIILPLVNPDGYKFSYEGNRFWRKTRSTNQHYLSHECPGVDANRNYDFLWNTSGTSSNPCTEVFCGSSPFSEVETRVVRDILNENLNRIALYINMHSFGSMILYPWAHDGSLSNRTLELHSVGVAMAKAIERQSLPSFPRYKIGNAASILHYVASGSSTDYAHFLGVVLSYTIELPGPETGFILDPIHIEQICRETWEGVVVGARRAGDLFAQKAKNIT